MTLGSPGCPWPPLPYADWADTCATLHLWTQVVGKIRLAHAPMVNHWWQVPFYVKCRGLTTSPIPYDSWTFQIDFDFIDQAAERQMPKYMEWYGAFGLMVTLVWLYLEMLRLLSKLANNRD